jgi:hypothetical protein
VHLSRNHQNIKDAFNEEVDFLGANIDFDASGAFMDCQSTLKEY